MYYLNTIIVIEANHTHVHTKFVHNKSTNDNSGYPIQQQFKYNDLNKFLSMSVKLQTSGFV